MHRAFKAPINESSFETLRVARHLDLERFVIEPHIGRARALRPVDQVGDDVSVLFRENEAEGQVAARDRKHAAV
jgi:hypothetical protein